MKVSKNLIIPIAIIASLVLFVYGSLTSSFYEQEEWLGLGNTFVYGLDYLLQVIENPLKMLLGDGRILSGLITYFFYTQFPFNTLPVSIFQITLHLTNSLLVFFLLKKTLVKTIPSLLGTAFFSVNAVAHSAVSWSAAISTLPATTLILIALHVLLNSTNNLSKVVDKKSLVLIILLLYISFLFKQIGIFMFILLPLAGAYMPSSKRKVLREIFTIKLMIPLSVFLLVLVSWLLYFRNILGPNALFLTGSNQNFFQTLTVRSILYPITSFSLIFVPPEPFLNFARHITNLHYPFFPAEHFILIAQTVVLDLLAVIFSSTLIASLFFLSKKSNFTNKMLWFFVVFIFVSFLPYVIIGKSFSYLDSRYYYLASVGATFVITWVLSVLTVESKKLGWIGGVFLIAIILVHAITTKRELSKQIKVAQERKQFLTQLTEKKPDLISNKNIFYITGSSDFYLPGHKVPFQNGFGHTLAVWYYHTGKIPKGVIKNRELFEIGRQGYNEYGDVGFGYFSDFNLLKQTISQHQIQPSAVIALYYDDKNKKVIDISSKIENDLQ